MQAQQRQELRRNKFAAALKGIDLDENASSEDNEDVAMSGGSLETFGLAYTAEEGE